MDAETYGSTLTYSATLANGDALPAWLSIDSTTGKITGTAVVGEYDISLSAFDGTSAVSDVFHLSVKNGPQAAPEAPLGFIDAPNENEVGIAGPTSLDNTFP